MSFLCDLKFYIRAVNLPLSLHFGLDLVCACVVRWVHKHVYIFGFFCCFNWMSHFVVFISQFFTFCCGLCHLLPNCRNDTNNFIWNNVIETPISFFFFYSFCSFFFSVSHKSSRLFFLQLFKLRYKIWHEIAQSDFSRLKVSSHVKDWTEESENEWVANLINAQITRTFSQPSKL